MKFAGQIAGLWGAAGHSLNEDLPSRWAAGRMRVTEGKFQGPLDYDNSPHCVEIVDCMSPHHPATNIVVMGGSQWGKTRGIIEPTIAYYIANHPCNIGYLTGHADLSEEAMQKLENALDNTRLDDGRYLREILRNVSLKKKNTRSGDTMKKKEFPGGSLISLSATNHKLLRQYNFKVIVPDDIEAARKASKQSGDTIGMITHRAASYGDDKKILWVSTPELKLGSIIEELFEKGDQRYRYVPCQRCGVYIHLQWSVDIPGSKDKAGMWWKPDSMNRPIRNSVEYICQECGHGFNERNKRQMLMDGQCRASAVPFNEQWVSFQMSSLYQMVGMNSWYDYAMEWVDAHPSGRPVDEAKAKRFRNLVEGLTYEPVNEAPSGNSIQKNCRHYAAGTVPDALSVSDGNGHIILLTAAIDMNGVRDDARLDWEIVGHSENGATYSIAHGSIGTFVPREGALGKKEDRARWTYELHKANSVWPELDKVLGQVFVCDGPPTTPAGAGHQHPLLKTGGELATRRMQVFMAGLDSGTHTVFAYNYIDSTNHYVVALKGDKEDKYLKYGIDVKWWKRGLERTNLYVLQVGLYKDRLSDYMKLNWTSAEDQQPEGFMNYPEPGNGMYTWAGFFEHYESEHRTPQIDAKGNMLFRWVKKNANSQNHFWDCRVYNLAMRDIVVAVVGAEYKAKDFKWGDYVRAVMG